MAQPCDNNNQAPNTEQPKDADAMFVLGINYSTGSGVEQNLVAAHQWFNLAAMMGHEAALSARAELAREMTSEQIAEAQRQARAWLWTRDAPAQAAADAKADIVRPIYVRRRAQAMRSASSFGRVVAGA
ncbi:MULTISPECIES: SEL1-like repeat protein [Rhodomicrobium]|uniref:SEL1-like repeat protein n=1 Tax=Rhodomicrobium TaxID=1068 RepID=UPI000F73BFB4|nr:MULTISPECIES: SEL1-like repeat protein [Rhodomicrobium]